MYRISKNWGASPLGAELGTNSEALTMNSNKKLDPDLIFFGIIKWVQAPYGGGCGR